MHACRSTLEDPTKRLEEAKEVLAHVSRRNQVDPALAALRTRVEALEASSQLPPEAELQGRIQADGADLQARLDLANRLIAERRFEPALEQLLAIVDRQREFRDDIARKTMIAVFDLAADQRELVANFRRRLAAALNR